MVERSGGGDDPTRHAWSVRARGAEGGREVRVYAGRHAFSVGRQASFSRDEPHPSAVEYLLGALAADLVDGYRRHAAERGAEVASIEAVASGELENPMVHLGVVGSEGRPGLGSVTAILYVSSEAGDATLQDAWRATLATSPLVSTIGRSARLSLELRTVP
ncbi:MAG: hypothetical protein ABSF83_15185 [Nitrososphaerales archaeon]|jgi:hypothetical protein